MAAEGGGGEGAAGETDGNKNQETEGKPEKKKKKKRLPKWDPYEDLDFKPMSGFTKLPELLLTLAAKHPFFGDIVKA